MNVQRVQSTNLNNFIIIFVMFLGKFQNLKKNCEIKAKEIRHFHFWYEKKKLEKWNFVHFFFVILQSLNICMCEFFFVICIYFIGLFKAFNWLKNPLIFRNSSNNRVWNAHIFSHYSQKILSSFYYKISISLNHY